MPEAPHITVAAVVERNGRFLMVREKSAGRIVYNQPAGHLEPGESLLEAVRRETLEETGWQIETRHFLGIYHHTSPWSGICYVRHCFVADPAEHRENAELDPDVLEPCWLSAAEIGELEAQLRSPMVWRVIDDYQRGIRYPLRLIHEGSM